MGKVFGCFTDIAWTNNRGWVSDGNGNTFVFSLRDDFNFVKLKCLNKYNEIGHGSSCLTWIGYCASGFVIHNDCNIYTNSISNLGHGG
jgi:hypothetical protein